LDSATLEKSWLVFGFWENGFLSLACLDFSLSISCEWIREEMFLSVIVVSAIWDLMESDTLFSRFGKEREKKSKRDEV